MAIRALLSDISFMAHPTSLVIATATGNLLPGFAADNVLSPLLNRSWKTDSPGTSNSVTVNNADMSGGVDCVLVCAHPEARFSGPVGVALLDFGGAVLWSGNSVYGSALARLGISDRRYFVLPFRVFGVSEVRVTVVNGDQVAYVAAFHALDLTALVDESIEVAPIDTIPSTELAAGGFVFDTSRRVAPGRKFHADIRLPAIPSSTLYALFVVINAAGKSEPLLWLPHAEDDPLATDSIDYMQATGCFGEIVNDPEFSFVGSSSIGALRSGVITLESWP